MKATALFHVAARPIPSGLPLRPYAVAQRYPALLRSAGEALGAGPGAVRRLLAGEAWGRLGRQGAGDYRAEMVLLEAIFERARVEAAPLLPSRLEAVYAWGSLALAERYRAAYRPDGVIHRCALVAGTTVELDAALVVEAFEVADLANPSDADPQRVAERAVRYWRVQAPLALPEVLVRGTVVVEAVVDADVEVRRG